MKEYRGEPPDDPGVASSNELHANNLRNASNFPQRPPVATSAEQNYQRSFPVQVVGFQVLLRAYN